MIFVSNILVVVSGVVIDPALEPKVNPDLLKADSTKIVVEEDNPMPLAKKRASTKEGQVRVRASRSDERRKCALLFVNRYRI